MSKRSERMSARLIRLLDSPNFNLAAGCIIAAQHYEGWLVALLMGLVMWCVFTLTGWVFNRTHRLLSPATSDGSSHV